MTELNGFKAFSYFNLVAKNYFIQKVKTYKKNNVSDVPFDKQIASTIDKNDGDHKIPSFENKIINAEFYELLKDELKKWRLKFDKKQEKLVLEAIILILENPDLVGLFNKKAIFLYLRELSGGLKTKQLVTNLYKFRRKYEAFKRRYHQGNL